MAVRILAESATESRLLLTCEHASCEVPQEYAALGLAPDQLREHIGWDIGAAVVTEALGRCLGAPAVLCRTSRLLVDCNRELGDHDLMVSESHGVSVPGNAVIDETERSRRLERFYYPYHEAIDRQLGKGDVELLLSVHSFTPRLNGRERAFDVGVLFDDFVDLAEEFVARLEAAAFSVRSNEPYSAYDGLIFSAQSHGLRHGVRYLEIEINNHLLRTDDQARGVAERLANPLLALVAEERRVTPTMEGKCGSF